MPKLPRIFGSKLLKILIKHFNFRALRQRGSHVTLTNDFIFVTVPLHKELDKGTLRAILRDCEISRDEFFEHL